ncbi:MAG TPA: Gfo/Idh/MocA family oxidoreductase [Abditibacteriaceae bacterium]|jgi:predicted dehydrogenase
MINIGLIGIGAMGRMHFNCYGNNPDARIYAICDGDEAKLRGDWSSISLNLDDTKSDIVDLSGIKTYSDVQAILADPEIDMIDICLPTPLHAQITIAALRAGKHVLCEKPMAMNEDECAEMEAVARETGKQLLIGHCLRYWPEYVITDEIIRSGKFGRVLSASFHRSSGMPNGSFGNWLATGSESGGAVLDMHIHDVDTALWWFGEPDEMHTDGVIWRDLPLSADSIWRYNDGPLVTLHGSWDPHGGPFRMAFRVTMETASVLYDSATNVFQLLQATPNFDHTRDLKASGDLAYQKEIDDFVACLNEGRTIARVTPASSRLAVVVTRREMDQIAAKELQAVA